VGDSQGSVSAAPRGIFKVPLGIGDDDRLVSRTEATKGQRYRCPACLSPLLFKAGPIRADHFSHAPTLACHPETVIHEAAKRIVAQVVADWQAGAGPQPLVANRCAECLGEGIEPLGGHVDGARVEQRLADGLVADVALLRGEVVVAVVEIQVTHAVDPDKAARLTVPWLELRGEDVLADPIRWTPIASGNVRRHVCVACRARRQQATDLARSLAVDFDPTIYEPGIATCYRCGKGTLVFAWRRGQLHETEAPPQPRPSVIELRFSRMAGHRYWANVCLHCHSLFGDWFLFAEPDGPFFGRADLQGKEEYDYNQESARALPRKPLAPRRIASRTSPYDVEVVRCPECRLETRYFTWQGDEPPEPRPESVWRDGALPQRAAPHGILPLFLPATKGVWWNHCAYCQASLE
jgi:Competence protein CoiA-like family